MAKIGELVRQIDRVEKTRPESSYRLLGVRLGGNGPFLRETVTGAQSSANALNQVHSGDFIYSRLFAWRGAFGMIPKELHGAFVSNEFPLFQTDPARLDVRYLSLWFQLPSVWRRVEENCTGSTPTTRNRFKEHYFLDLDIPLPRLAEQRAIVAHLAALAEKTRQVEEHLEAVERDAAALFLSLHHGLAGDRTVRLGDVLQLREHSEPVIGSCSYPQVGIRGFGGGMFPKSAVHGHETSYRAFNRLFAGAIVLSQVKGWEGAIARCPDELAGWYASPEYRTFRCVPRLASDEYVGALVSTEWFWTLLQEATRGVGARRERTRPEQFLNIELPLPLIDDQLRIVDVLRTQAMLKVRRAVIREANAALIPATLERVFGETRSA